MSMFKRLIVHIVFVVVNAIAAILILGVPKLWLFSDDCACVVNNLIDVRQHVDRYSVEQLSVLAQRIRNNDHDDGTEYTFDDVKSLFNIRYLRQTLQGYYSIIPSDASSSLYLFFNRSFECTHAMMVSALPTIREAIIASQAASVEYNELGVCVNTELPYYQLPLSSGRPGIFYYCSDGGVAVVYSQSKECQGRFDTVAYYKTFSNDEIKQNAIKNSLSGEGDYLPILLQVDLQNRCMGGQAIFRFYRCIIFCIVYIIIRIGLYISFRAKPKKSLLMPLIESAIIGLSYILCATILPAFLMSVPIVIIIVLPHVENMHMMARRGSK